MLLRCGFILQISFSSYQISLSFNQSFVAKIRSISISSLLATFIALFIFIGNLGRIPQFSSFLERIMTGRETLTAVLASQIMSKIRYVARYSMLSSFLSENPKRVFLFRNRIREVLWQRLPLSICQSRDVRGRINTPDASLFRHSTYPSSDME